MPKAKKKFTSIRQLAMSKNADFINKAKRPILEAQSKSQFKSMIDNSQNDVLNIRKEIIDSIMNVKNLDVPRILEKIEEISDIKKTVEGVMSLYKAIFGEEYRGVDINDFTVDLAADTILDAANDLDEENDS